MEHEEIIDRLSEYIDGELSAADKELVERHLQACPECAETLAALRAVTEVLTGTPRVSLPEEAADRLAAAIDEHLKSDPAPAARTARASWRRWATHPAFLSVAGAAAVLVIAVAVWRSPAQKSEPTLLRAPAISAPQAGRAQRGNGGFLLQPSTAGTDAATRQIVDRRLAEIAAGILPTSLSGQPPAPGESSSGSKELLFDRFNGGGKVSVDKAAMLAGAGHPVHLLYSTPSAWKRDAAWIVVVERTDKPGYFIGAVVSQKDGRILYRRTKQRP